MERLTREADFGFEDWEETLFFVKSDPNGAYNILDIAKYQGEEEFDKILINIAIRLADIEDILGDDYDLDRLRVIVNQRISLRDEVAERFKLTSKIPIDRLQELIQADRDGRCVIRPVKLGTPVWSSVFCRVDDDGIEHPTYPWEFDDSMLAEWGTGWHLTEEDALKTLED